MRERGILMTAPNVRGILAGTKTQTRRIVKWPDWMQPRPDVFVRDLEGGKDVYYVSSGPTKVFRCPYGVVGDRLWVRETWAQTDPRFEPLCPLAYRATDDGRALLNDRWRPSIFMPRWASRITLEITDVRVERLQEISEADCVAEGIVAHRKGGWWWEQPPPGIEGTNHFGAKTARDAYRALWESINGSGSWDVNPWVWAISFRRVT